MNAAIPSGGVIVTFSYSCKTRSGPITATVLLDLYVRLKIDVVRTPSGMAGSSVEAMLSPKRKPRIIRPV